MRPSIAACVLAVACLAFPAIAAEPYTDLERRLTPEQLHETGLDTLSPDQLARLNALLREEQTQALDDARAAARADAEVEAEARRQAEARAATDAARPERGRFVGLDDGPIRSRILGDVGGWAPGDEFRLENGQQWKILKGSMRLRTPLHSPEVLVVPGIAGRWFLQFDEDMPKARVYRID